MDQVELCPTKQRFSLRVEPHKTLTAYAHVYTIHNDKPVCVQSYPIKSDPNQKSLTFQIPLPGTNPEFEYAPITFINLSLSDSLESIENPKSDENIVTVSWWSNGYSTSVSDISKCGPDAYGGIQTVYPGLKFTADVGVFPGNQGEGLAIFAWEKIPGLCPVIPCDPCKSKSDFSSKVTF